MSVNEFKTDLLKVWMLGKKQESMGLLGLLLMKATLENFRIYTSVFLFCICHMISEKISLMLAMSDKVTVVASESHSSNN